MFSHCSVEHWEPQDQELDQFAASTPTMVARVRSRVPGCREPTLSNKISCVNKRNTSVNNKNLLTDRLNRRRRLSASMNNNFSSRSNNKNWRLKQRP